MINKGRIEDLNTFGIIGATILDNFNLERPQNNIGNSILDKITNERIIDFINVGDDR
jgi:phosphopentomutase